MADSVGQAEIKTDYPYTSGLTARTTKQKGRRPYLTPQLGSKVFIRNKALI